MPETSPSLKLPLQFDASLLQLDLALIRPEEWVPHFNRRYYEGIWSAVPLRSVGGHQLHIYPDPTKQAEYADTELLARCGHLRDALAKFDCPLLSVRLLRLDAGSSIREHRDYNLSLEDGEVRIHVPVATSPKVEFYLDGVRTVMKEGECWYLNLNLPHRVENQWDSPRVHLVIDCVVNDWLRDQLR